MRNSLVAGLSFLAIAILGCSSAETLHIATAFSRSRPECPEAWPAKLPIWDKDPNAPPQDFDVPPKGLAVPGEMMNIPEFHDCQRFIKEDGSDYSAFNAIFASSTLLQTTTSLDTSGVTWAIAAPASPPIATLTPDGLLTGLKSGTVQVTATLAGDPSVSFTGQIKIDPGVPPARQRVLQVGPGVPEPPSVVTKESVQLVALLGPVTHEILPVAQIYSYGEGYAHLGFGPNFSCLFVYFNDHHALAAKMVQVAPSLPAKSACATAINPNAVDGTVLEVRRTPAPADDFVPQVARWDLDANRKYSIGIACGIAWCDIGKAIGATPFTPSANLLYAASLSDGEFRVRSIKGWYDQQELAVFKDDPLHPGEKVAVPSGIVGTVIPIPSLERLKLRDYDVRNHPIPVCCTEATKSLGTKAEAINKAPGMTPNMTGGGAAKLSGSAPSQGALGSMMQPGAWRLTAYVAFDISGAKDDAAAQYLGKFGFASAPIDGPLSKMNRLSLCMGTRENCTVPDAPAGATTPACFKAPPTDGQFWVKIESADPTRAPVYRCGIRRTHGKTGEKYIAPTARWRWLAADETTWEFCDVSGCCETGPGW